MADSLKKGDKVTWDTGQGKIKGVVDKTLTTETRIKGYTAKPTKDDPQYLVKSEKTGAKAAHKPKELKKS